MIADWTVDIGPDAPSIDLPWDGWVDLRWDEHKPWRPEAAGSLEEARRYPEIPALLKLANSGRFFTSKVDVFPVTREEVDPEVAEAGQAASRFGLGSYLDIVTNPPELVPGFDHFEAVARLLASDLGKMELRALGSVEIVLRQARLFGRETFGWTMYAMGFGPTGTAARSAWSTAAFALLTALQAGPATMLSAWPRSRISSNGE